MIVSKKLNKYKSISHGFFNIKGGVSTGIYKSLNCGPGSNDKPSNIKKNILIVCKKIGCKSNNLVLLNQIHSKKIYEIKKIPKIKLSGDGLYTKTKMLALGILTADCAPIIIFDKLKKNIGIVHAGWRGAYKEIVIKMLNLFIKKGSLKKNIIVVIGPSIKQKNYEVKFDFKRRFLKKSSKNERYFTSKNNKIYFSLSDFIKGQLIDFGVKNIDIIKKDTYTKRNNFFSARRSLHDKQLDYGRNISIIMIK